MANREIQIPFGPDKTGGLGLQPIPAEDEQVEAVGDPFAEPTVADVAALDDDYPTPSSVRDSQDAAYAQPEPVQAAAYEPEPGVIEAAYEVSDPGSETGEVTPYEDEDDFNQGMDEVQESFAALRDSIGQGRELKAREKEREELAEALDADHVELADRENILANYHALVAEQDAIIEDHNRLREAHKDELSRITVDAEQTQADLEQARAYYAQQMQPIEADLGRIRATADQAKNDERSRKSELNAAEAELRRADDSAANTVIVAKHQQTQAAYDEARKRSEAAKEQLAQVQKAYDDAKQQAEQAIAPLERRLADLNAHAEEHKESINKLGEEITAARNRRQYCDNVYQYPEQTAQMRSEIEAAEVTARQMDEENDLLREQLAQSKQKAKKAKIAIGIVIAIVVVFIIALLVVSNR